VGSIGYLASKPSPSVLSRENGVGRRYSADELIASRSFADAALCRERGQHLADMGRAHAAGVAKLAPGQRPVGVGGTSSSFSISEGVGRGGGVGIASRISKASAPPIPLEGEREARLQRGAAMLAAWGSGSWSTVGVHRPVVVGTAKFRQPETLLTAYRLNHPARRAATNERIVSSMPAPISKNKPRARPTKSRERAA
jgi:hypothetical protein